MKESYGFGSNDREFRKTVGSKRNQDFTSYSQRSRPCPVIGGGTSGSRLKNFRRWSVSGSQTSLLSHQAYAGPKISDIAGVITMHPPDFFRGLFLESPGNFSGPKSNIQIEI